MKNKLLKALYDCFYIPPEFPAQKQVRTSLGEITSTGEIEQLFRLD